MQEHDKPIRQSDIPKKDDNITSIYVQDIKEIAASAVGAAGGVALAGAPLVAIGAAAIVGPVVYECIKRIGNRPSKRK